VSALSELEQGQVGDELLALLRRTIRAVAITRNIPAPDERGVWDDEAVGRIVSEFMADRRTPRRLTDLATVCMTDTAVRARLQEIVRNFFADLGRRTPIGKLVVRINDVLNHRDDFARIKGRWTLFDGPAEAGVADDDRFDRAIASRSITVPNWGHQARRAAPVADAETIAALCQSLLEAAEGSLTPRVLAAAIGRRLGVGQAPISLDVSALDGGWAEPGRSLDVTGSEALRPMHAAEIMGMLNDRERLALAFPDYTVRQLAPLLGVNHSQAHVIRQRAVAVLKVELVDDDDAEGVAMQVLDLVQAWVDEWTTPSDSTF
jgi:hypothetical protein